MTDSQSKELKQKARFVGLYIGQPSMSLQTWLDLSARPLLLGVWESDLLSLLSFVLLLPHQKLQAPTQLA